MIDTPSVDCQHDRSGRAAGSIAGALILAAALGGCGMNVGGIEPTWPPSVAFSHWDSLSASSCRGWLSNIGHPARNVRVQLWYATALGETSQVVFVGSVGDPGCKVPCFELTPFNALPQLTGGEPRFPRVGVVSWDGGTTAEAPRAPSIRFTNWCWTATDSLLGTFTNDGGAAYHVVVTLETRDGVRDLAPPSGRLQMGERWRVNSVARESTAILLPPKILEVRWEDYGGVLTRRIAPPADTATSRCY